MRVTSVAGHLMEMDFDAQYKSWGGCQAIDLFDAPVHKYVPDDKTDVAENLKDQVTALASL